MRSGDGSTSAIVVLAGPDDLAKEVRETLTAWAAAGLLEPLLWVRRDTLGSDNPADVMAELIAGDGTCDVRLFDALAQRRFTVLRAITAHLLIEPEAGLALVEEGEHLARVLCEALGASQTLERLNVIVPVSGLIGITPRLVHDPESKHIVLSPEDRQTGRQVSRPITHPGVYVPHAAMGIATLSGGWPGMGAGPFDGTTFSGSPERTHVVVTRTFVRLLRAGALTERVTTEVFERRRKEAWTAAAVDAVNASNPQHLVNDLASRLSEVEDRAMTYRPAPQLAAIRLQEVGILAAFRMMLSFIVGRLRALPGQVVARITNAARGAVEGMAQGMTFGGRSSVVVAYGGRARIGPSEEAASSRDVDYATKLLRDMGRNPSPPSTAGLWQALRRVAFGLVDAGGFPEGVDAPTDGARRLVVNDVGVIVADPTGRFSLDRTLDGAPAQLPEWAYEPIQPWDAQRASDLRELLTHRQSMAEHGRPAGEGRDGEQAAAVEPDPALADRLRAMLAALERFCLMRRQTLLWQVAAGLGAQQRQAAQSFDDALRTARAGEPSPDEAGPREARKRLRNWWLVALLAAATPGAVVYWLQRRGVADSVEWLALIAASVGIWLLSWFATFVAYQRRMFQIQYEIARKHRAYVQALQQAEHDAAEVVRLWFLYVQLMDWAAVIAWLTHHPEGAPPRHSEPAAQQLAGLPLSMRLARGTASETTLQRTSAVVGRRVFGRGWLGNLYRRYATASMQELKAQMGLPHESPDPDPDHDLAEPSPRAYLKQQIGEGVYASAWRASVHEQVDGALRKQPPDELFQDIAPLDGHGGLPSTWEGPAPSAALFLGELIPHGSVRALQESMWVDEARLERAEEVQTLNLWSPVAPVTEDVAACVRLWDQAELPSTQGTFSLSAIRLDVSRPCPPDQLWMFASRQARRPEAGGQDWDGQVG
ncbi:MAG: hypothetical protein H0V12_11130 [Chloroflexi bacterium]|nr:hypothetical protein [Chloroflexota bacterium]